MKCISGENKINEKFRFYVLFKDPKRFIFYSVICFHRTSLMNLFLLNRSHLAVVSCELSTMEYLTSISFT